MGQGSFWNHPAGRNAESMFSAMKTARARWVPWPFRWTAGAYFPTALAISLPGIPCAGDGEAGSGVPSVLLLKIWLSL